MPFLSVCQIPEHIPLPIWFLTRDHKLRKLPRIILWLIMSMYPPICKLVFMWQYCSKWQFHIFIFLLISFWIAMTIISFPPSHLFWPTEKSEINGGRSGEAGWAKRSNTKHSAKPYKYKSIHTTPWWARNLLLHFIRTWDSLADLPTARTVKLGIRGPGSHFLPCTILT